MIIIKIYLNLISSTGRKTSGRNELQPYRDWTSANIFDKTGEADGGFTWWRP